MSKVVKRAVAQMVGTLGHVGLTMGPVSRFNEHVSNRAERVHVNRRRDTITIDALKRCLREPEPFLERKIRRVIVALIRMFSGKRVVDGRIADWPPFNDLATEAGQANTSRDCIAMNHVFCEFLQCTVLG